MPSDPRLRTRVATAVAAGVATLAFLAPVGHASATATTEPAGPATREGSLTLVDVGGKAVASGNSDTIFNVKLPQGATCPGDTVHDQWRFQIFLAPKDLDIDDVDLGVLGPQNEHSKALYTTDGKYGADQFLQPNDAAGQPGRFPSLPFFTFARFPKQYFPSGSYRVVVLCTFYRQPVKYWDTPFDLANTDADGGAAGFRWTAPEAPADAVDATPSEPTNWKPFAGIAIFAVCAAAGFALWRSSSATTSREDLPS